MSTRPSASAPRAKRPAVTLSRLAEKKALGEPIAMVTAYDHPSAQVAEEAGVDVVLVGDSAAMTVLGYPSTVPVSLDEMLMLAAAVRRGLSTPFLVGDLPFGSYEGSNEQAVATAQRFVKQAGCDAVKLERGGTSAQRARAIVGAGIPVMGHVGLTPQTAIALGGYRSQGRTAERALEVARDALALQDAGCFAIVFEAIPSALTEAVMPRMEVPVIGIGAGPTTDGQVLVFHDLLGIYDGHAARFVKRYADVRRAMVEGVARFAREVRERRYPAPEHGYTMAPDEVERLHAALRTSETPFTGGPSLQMGLHTGELRLSTRGDGDVIDLTAGVLDVLRAAGVEDGLVSVFVPGSTAAVTSMEFEPGGVHDLRATLDRLVPAAGDYEHNRLNHDTNSHAHIRAAIVGPSETVPVRGGRLATGTWQQIVLVDFDDRPRRRTVVVQVVS